MLMNRSKLVEETMLHTTDYSEDQSTITKNEQEENQACVQICRSCLSVDGIIPVDTSMSQSFTEVTGVQWDMDGFPCVLCVQCKAIVTKCRTFRDKAQRVNDLLTNLMIGNDNNITNINDIKRMQLGIKPLLEPRHYPPNHCDLYHDADVQKEENYVKIEITDHIPESKTIQHEYSNSHVVKSFGDLWNSPKREVLDSIGQDDFLNEEIDIDENGDIKDAHLIDCATATADIPDFRYSESEPSTSIIRINFATNSNEFICDNCNLTFKSRVILIRHLSKCGLPNNSSLKRSRDLKSQTVQNTGVFNFKSSETCNLKMPMKAQKEERRHVCLICGLRFKRVQHLNNHTRTHTGEKPHACDICDHKYSRLDILKTHMKTHYLGEKPHACNICDRNFFRSDHLKIHMETHTEEELYAPKDCNICGREFSRLDLLKKHMSTHIGEKRYVCNSCGRRFFRADHLKKHMAIHTGEKPYACNICDYKFSRTDHLKKHLKTHVEKLHASKDLKSDTEVQKFYVCDFCGYKSAHAFNLKTHLRTHTGEKPYACSVCDSKFSLPGGLKTHMRTHTGERPYTCNVCDSKFARLQHLNDHMRTHTGEKPHVCNICDCKFARSNHLKTHMRTHTGEKPFACNICDLKFAQSFNLKTHMRIHTGEKPYACNDCDFKCSYRRSFKIHLKSHVCRKFNSI